MDFEAIVSEAVRLVNAGMTASDAVAKVWIDQGIPMKLYEDSKSKIYKSLGQSLGLSLVERAGDIAQAYDKLYNDKQLKQTIAKASSRLRTDVRKSVTEAIKTGKNQQAFARDIRNIAMSNDADTRGAIEKGLKQLYNTPLENQVKVIERRLKAGIKTDQLRQSYADLIKASENPDNLAKIIKQQDYALKAKLKSNAERIYNTESARATDIGDSEAIASDPDVKYVKIVLEKRNHHINDICDAVCDANPTGYGKGIYELKDAPALPLHPNCNCRKIPVYRVGKQGKTTSINDETNKLDIRPVEVAKRPIIQKL